MPRGIATAAGILLSLLLAVSQPACIGVESAVGDPPTGVSAPTSAAPTITVGTAETRPEDRLASMARADLARRLSLGEADIVVVSTTAETWRDASFGCPEPGKVYAQVLTEGYRIVLEARGQRYEYHTDSSRVVPCPPL